MNYEKSNSYFKKSLELVPGGVHSPVRSFKGMPQTPVFFEKAKGAYLHSVDGHKYIDFCMSFGPLILGHADPEVEEELHKAISRGWSFGACEPYSLALAEYILSQIPFIQQIRFVNSGTEAVMTALRLCRGFTRKSKIVKFHGCYHGHTDSMLIKAGSGLAGTSEASSLGIPPSVANDTIVLELGDFSGLEECFQKFGRDIAGVIIEPLPANYGLLPQEPAFLQRIRQLTLSNDSLLIFDEVISGFRVGFQGMSGELQITPDLVTYGKILGGGFPVGAVGGRKEIMEYLAPLGNVYQAGTLSANPVAMIAGLTTVKKLTPTFYEELGNHSFRILQILQKYFNEQEWAKEVQLVSAHSLFWITLGSNPIQNVQQIPADLPLVFQRIFLEFLAKGIYLAPNAYEVGFISHAHHQEVIDELEKRLWEK